MSQDEIKLFTSQELEAAYMFNGGMLFSVGQVARIRLFSLEHLLQIGKQLGIRQRVIRVAGYYFKIFYMNHSFIDYDPRLLAATCLFVASKVNEFPILASDMLRASKSFESWTCSYDKSALLTMEITLLTKLSGQLSMGGDPVSLMVKLCTDASLEPLIQMAVEIINDTQRCDVELQYTTTEIAIGAIYMAAVYHRRNIFSWLDEIKIDSERIRAFAKAMNSSYHVGNQ